MAINKTVAGTFVVDFRDQHGKRLRKTFDTLSAARDFNKQSLGAVSKGEFVSPSNDTIKDIAERWHARKKDAGTYRFSTLGNWRAHIEKYIIPQLGDSKIQQVSVEAVESAAAEWARITSLIPLTRRSPP